MGKTLQPLSCVGVFLAELGGLLMLASEAGAYPVNCNNSSFQAQVITSVMGEARPSSTAGAPLRFHLGVDIADGQCASKHPVGAIEAGTITALGPDVPSCGENATDCVRITSLDGTHAFDYIHTNTTFTKGTTVQANQVIGTITALAHPHLHLNDINLSQGFAQNPQAPGRLDFNGSAQPSAEFVPGIVGGLSGLIVPITAFTAGQDFTNTTPQPLQTASDGSFLAIGPTDLLVTASAPRTTIPRMGVYGVGVIVTPADDPTNQVYNGSNNILFDSILDGVGNDKPGVMTVYASLNSNSFTYFSTHRKVGVQADEANPLDFSQFPAGQYQACAEVDAYPSAPPDHIATTCINFQIQSQVPLPPTLTVQAGSSQGPVITDGSYSELTTLFVSATSGAGIASISIESLDISNQEAPAYLQADSFDGVAIATAAFSNLPEGDYWVKAIDVNQNETDERVTVFSAPIIQINAFPQGLIEIAQGPVTSDDVPPKFGPVTL